MRTTEATAASTAEVRYAPDCSWIESNMSGLGSTPLRSSGMNRRPLTSSIAPATNAEIAAGRAQRASH